MLTLADFTRPLRPHIPLPVVSHEAFERILTLTSRFPAALANHVFGLEVHLGESTPFVDVFLYFSEGQLSLLPESISERHWQDNYPEWQKVARLFSVWSDPASVLYRKTDHAWLCFDLEQPVPDVPIPDLFYCSISKKSDPLLTLNVLTDIFAEPAAAALAADNLALCIRSIPEGAVLSQAGFGLSRACGTVRLQIIDFTPQQLPAYLRTIGWAYPTEPLQSVLDQFSLCDLLTVMIDVSTSIHPKIGIEGVLKSYDARWQTVLDDLVEQGLCQPGKRDFLTMYPEPKLCQMDSHISLTRQRLSHVKIGYHPEKPSAPLEAKAYLAYYPDWPAEAIVTQPDSSRSLSFGMQR